MMIKKTVIYLSLILIVPILYLVFREKIVTEWNSIESLITLTAYWTSIILFWYNSDMKFHFFVNRILMFFKYDHTIWIISSRYRIVDYDEIFSIQILSVFLLNSFKNIRIKEQQNNYLEILFANKYLLHFRLQQFESDNYELHFYTSKIVVPTRENKKQIFEITEILEKVEKLLRLKVTDTAQYEIDIEYNEKSPYYSFWIKKLPEEMISNFNCSIKLPNISDFLTVNKNHLIIRSDRYSKLFQLTNDYVVLKSVQ